MSDIDTLAARAYASGYDPIDWAIRITVGEMTTRDDILYARAENPDAHPEYLLDLDDGAVARRIIGRLLDAGWHRPIPPGRPSEGTAP